MNRSASISIAGDGSTPTVTPETSAAASAAANMPVPVPTSSVADLSAGLRDKILSTQACNELVGIALPRWYTPAKRGS